MVRRIQDEDLQMIEEVVRDHPEGVTAQQIAAALDAAPPRRTLQYRLKSLVDEQAPRPWRARAAGRVTRAAD